MKVLRALQPQTTRDVVERLVDGERCRGQHDGAVAIENGVGHQSRHIDGRRTQEHAARAQLHEVDEIRVVGAEQEAKVVAQLARASLQRADRFTHIVGQIGRLASGLGAAPRQQRESGFEPFEGTAEHRPLLDMLPDGLAGVSQT
jgi:hypothetical protein